MVEAVDLLHAFIGRDDGEIAWWQMCNRPVLIFVFGLMLVRAAGKRVFGKWGAIDILLSVIIGSNLSRTLTGSAPFLPTLAATAVLVVLHRIATMAALRLPALGPILKGRTARLILDGEVDRAALRRHGVGEHDLESALRGAGLLSTDGVAEAWLERNGDISIIKR
jgi:uncharacterized membrane protein YcaP (DUF421 family)